MITVYPHDNLGRANYGWLDARHHFSFAEYHNPERMQFGVLRVINDDIIKAGTGFEMHPHRDMEIITYVRKGAITHRDSNGNHGRTEAGDVQVMSAGTGIFHSEHNEETIDTNLFQIWILPNKKNVAPRWDSHDFPKQATNSELKLLVSGNGDAPLHIHQDVKIYAGKLPAGITLSHSIHNQAYLLVSHGQITIENQQMNKGDGAEISQQPEFTLSANSEAEILVIDVPLI
ncbi:MAG: pirin family protein [Acidiferrobacterales bacterium]|nr:pirin family protein [Acidiferrobacterales bacterium]